MTVRPMFDMLEATRLTREGRLLEAMAVLHGARPRTDPTTTDDDHHAKAHQTNAGASLEMVPPSQQTGSSWTLPLFGKGVASLQRNDMGLERLLGRGVMPAPFERDPIR